MEHNGIAYLRGGARKRRIQIVKVPLRSDVRDRKLRIREKGAGDASKKPNFHQMIEDFPPGDPQSFCDHHKVRCRS